MASYDQWLSVSPNELALFMVKFKIYIPVLHMLLENGDSCNPIGSARSSHQICSIKSCLKIFCNNHKKTTVLESLFNKAAGLDLSLYWKDTPTQVFSCEYCEIFKTPILNNICERMLLFCACDKTIRSLLNGVV